MSYKSDLQLAIDRIKSYSSAIGDEYLSKYEEMNTISGNKIFQISMFYELYIYQLEYSLEWFEDDEDFTSDSPITKTDISNLLNSANEIINTLFEQPIQV